MKCKNEMHSALCLKLETKPASVIQAATVPDFALQARKFQKEKKKKKELLSLQN